MWPKRVSNIEGRLFFLTFVVFVAALLISFDLGGFGYDFGRVWEGFWEVWGRFSRIFDDFQRF